MKDYIEQLPKAELHVHLEGTLEPEMSFAIAQRNNIDLPYKTVEDVLAAYDFYDLPSFLAIYYAAMGVLQQEQDFYDLTYAYLTKAASQNTVYVEPFFDPQAHLSRGVAFDTIIQGIHKAQVDAAENLGIKSQLIMCFLRDMSAESAMETLELSLPYRDWIIGVGLDSDEKNNPPVKFQEVFAKAREYGYKLTMHCDVNQDNTLGHIEQCLYDIKVDRIDHGINSLESESIINEIVTRGLGLTVCPVSNRYVVQSLTSNEIKTMLEKDMRVTINSDDPAYFRAYLNENFVELQQEGNFSKEEIVTLIANAFKVAWLDESQKQSYLEQLQAAA
ncbi:adenosine deaminase [Methylophaga sp.]|uniref:adenosine deaminase n=1 Tax=Methylophaga sp. TaxID=2024840 RepID=UPI0027172519|nr:adenosine deaminase [Methylophaga sp.]MDO8826875.1 adenosine deaminase [Methylophaga sp.]